MVPSSAGWSIASDHEEAIFPLARRCMALMDIDRKHVEGIVDEAKSW
jgi:hypothetical protein